MATYFQLNRQLKIYNSQFDSIINSEQINADSGNGIWLDLESNVTLIDNSGYQIAGGSNGIYIGGVDSVTTINNQSSSIIAGGQASIQNYGSIGTIINAGTLSGPLRNNGTITTFTNTGEK